MLILGCFTASVEVLHAHTVPGSLCHPVHHCTVWVTTDACYESIIDLEGHVLMHLTFRTL